ncbi:hypothetical protein [Bradyrhizobium sp. 188]|uniref:hypothetical protein n=1 Tax=Bradyrhizobium sp. 188 TaxID=2782656 RepID=UPI001FF8EADC|nr:hypothetical protein [Bradyrhizobium sp. 188]MCK1501486.1 hypothetical protein [Bradyrhizobium sp. 188]
MSVMNFFVLTSAQVATSESLDDNANATIVPRAIDNTSPGVGINLNNNATGVLAGATVVLTGMFVAPKRIVDDPDYLHYCPNLSSFLLTLPFCSLETETIFAPVVP